MLQITADIVLAEEGRVVCETFQCYSCKNNKK